MKAQTVLETIGNTPHIRINHLFNTRVEVWLKAERANPGGSIKDRAAVGLIQRAEADGGRLTTGSPSATNMSVTI